MPSDQKTVMCTCGCGMTYAEAIASARANSGWLSPDQAEADVRSMQKASDDQPE